MKRKFLCLLLALTMVLSLAATVSAEERYTSGDWTYTFSEGELSIISYDGSDTNVVVPEKLDGLPVRILGWGLTPAFSGVKNTMTSITLPEGLTHIERQCFKNCTNLTSVTLPSTVAYISSSAFEGCTKLAEVELNEGLTSIGEFAFLNTALTSLYIPASVTDIGTDAIGYTGEWGNTAWVDDFTIYGYTDTSAEWYANHNYFTFVDMGANYDNSGRCGDSLAWEYTAATGTLLIYGPPNSSGGYMYDYDLEEIPWAIHKPFIKSVVIESGLDITDYAFQDCTNLTTVTMGDTVEDIRSCAFKNTPKLTSVKLSANLDYISTAAFLNSGLTSIELPDSLTGIGTEAFCNTPLTSIVIPDSVTSIAQGAFYYCADLASVKLPAELDEIYPLVFQGCTSLKSIDLPESLRIIGRQAFSHAGLTAIEIPDSVVLIDENAFFECMDLEYVKLPASLEETGWRCFQDCDKLSTIVMPDGIDTNFGQWFFLSCDSLTNLDFHTSPIIGMAMYGNCNGLTVLNIPECVTTISDFAFNYCENLSYVTIPAGVTEFGAKPFHDCPKLGAIAFRGDAPAFHEFAFEDTTVTCYYPAGNDTWTEEVRQSYNGEVTWIPYEVLPFTDVPANEFYFDSVSWAVENGITNGMTATEFGAGANCNRAQAVTFLWRAAGSPAPTSTENPFVDVKKGEFYEQAVLWAVENGITNGTDATHFSPDKACNRATIVTFLYRAFENPAVTGTENPFSDVPADTWYTAPVLWAVEEGITLGMGGDIFGVDNICNRAQMVTFLCRAYNN